ncbi:3-dehydroquinate dehydratase [Candidatus Microgenomates bacterium]|nr:3-dehydroquinate dehydratase [Candidatus Microgenomates bacterium]
MKILVLNGPNLNMLGRRSVKHYGVLTLIDIKKLLVNLAQELGVKLVFFQSNHEGALVDAIQKYRGKVDGIMINPGALTHYGYSLRDSLEDAKVPVVETHLSDITKREAFRKKDVLTGIVVDRIMGLKEQSYLVGLKKLIKHIKKL